MMRRLFQRSYTYDANSSSLSSSSSAASYASSGTTIRSQASTESANELSSHSTTGHHSIGHRSSSQPATLRNGTFNEISAGNWTYCLETPNVVPSVTGFGNVPIVSYDVIETMGDRKLKLCAVTWNINEKPVKVLEHLAQKISERKEEMDSDLFFISFQEIPAAAATFHEDALRILEPVFSGHRLYLSHRAWCQMIIVFIRHKHIRYAIQPQVSFVQFGIFKPKRTKGAITVCLRLYQRFIVLIGCHMSHATPQLRIQDYTKLVRTLRFPQLSKFHPEASAQIFGSDVVLWIGDLNFRVTLKNDVDWTNPDKHQEKIYDDILKTEEFESHLSTKEAFADFKEAPIRFPPTHKFYPDTETYVADRLPSFTDRVLYWSRNSEWVQPIKYDCMRGANPSDHKAVFATVWLTVINKPVPEYYRQQKSLENGSIKSLDSTDQDH